MARDLHKTVQELLDCQIGYVAMSDGTLKSYQAVSPLSNDEYIHWIALYQIEADEQERQDAAAKGRSRR